MYVFVRFATLSETLDRIAIFHDHFLPLVVLHLSKNCPDIFRLTWFSVTFSRQKEADDCTKCYFFPNPGCRKLWKGQHFSWANLIFEDMHLWKKHLTLHHLQLRASEWRGGILMCHCFKFLFPNREGWSSRQSLFTRTHCRCKRLAGDLCWCVVLTSLRRWKPYIRTL